MKSQKISDCSRALLMGGPASSSSRAVHGVVRVGMMICLEDSINLRTRLPKYFV